MRDQTVQKQGDSDPGATAVSGEAESRVLTVNTATTRDDYDGGGYGLAWRDLEGIDRDINAPPGATTAAVPVACPGSGRTGVMVGALTLRTCRFLIQLTYIT